MSSIDTRVVKMTFDNDEFEKKAGTTLTTLEKLKESLNFSGAVKGLESIAISTRDLALDSLAENVEALQYRFSVLGEFVHNVFMDMINSAVQAGQAIADALVITPMTEGFGEYETQMNSIQTILSNTKNKGTTLEDVTSALDELNTYADKTIYNFTEMTRNIGTFTAAGVDLDTSVKAIQGIANLSAMSGVDSTAAARAMYQLSQAIASGVVHLQDWNSVQNAGLGGDVFKNAIMDTARVHGIAIDEMMEQAGNFRNLLMAKDFGDWFTDDILLETLEKFTAGSEGITQEQLDQMQELYRARGYTEDQIKSLTEAQKVLTQEEINEARAYWANKGYNEDQIDQIFELGKAATEAATEVKTFHQLLGTLAEGLGSGWTKSWELIVGDFEEAKALWTEIYQILDIYIGASSRARNEMLQQWHDDANGRTAVIDGLRNAFQALLGLMLPIKQAWDTVFPPLTAERLIELSTKFRDFTANLKLTDEQQKTVRENAVKFFEKLKIAYEGVKSVAFSLIDVLKRVGAGIQDAFSSFDISKFGGWADRFKSFADAIKPSEKTLENIQKIATGVSSVFRALINIASDLAAVLFDKLGVKLQALRPDAESFMDSIGEAGDKLTEFASKLEEDFNYETFSGGVGMIVDNLSKLFDIIRSNVDLPGIIQNVVNFITGVDFSGISGFINGVLEGASGITDILHNIFTNLGGEGGLFSTIVNGVKNFLSQIDWDAVWNIVSHVESFIATRGFVKLLNMLEDVPGLLSGFKDSIKETLGAVQNDRGGFRKFLDSVREGFEAWQSSLKILKIIAIAASIAAIAYAVNAIGQLDIQHAITGVAGIAVVIQILIKALKSFDIESIPALGEMITFATVIGMLAGTLKTLGELEWKQLLKGVLGLGALMGMLTLVIRNMPTVSDGEMPVKVSGTILALAAAVFVLSMAVKKLGKMEPEKMIQGLAGVIAIMGALYLTIKDLNAIKGLDGGKIAAVAGAMVIIGIAVGMLASSVKKLAKLDPLSMILGLAGVIALMEALYLMMKELSELKISNVGSIAALAGVMIIIAAAIGMLASSVKKLAALEIGGLAVGLTGVIALMVSLMLLLKEMSDLTNSENFNLGSIAGLALVMIAIAAAVGMLSKSVERLASLSIEQLAIGLLGVIVGLVAMVKTLEALSQMESGKSGDLIKLAAAMLILAAAIGVVSKAVQTLGQMSLEQLAKGLVAVIVGLYAMATTLFMLAELDTSNIMKAALAMLVMSAAVAILAPAMLALSTMDLGGLIIALAAMAGAFVIMGVAGSVLKPTIGVVVAFAASVALLGIGLLALTVALNAVAGAFNSMGPEITNAISGALQALIDNMPLIGEAFLAFLTMIWDTLMGFIAEAFPKLLETLGTLVVSLGEFLMTVWPSLLTTVLTLLIQLGQAILEYGPQLFEIGIGLIVEFLRAIGESMALILTAGFELMGAFVAGVMERMGEIVDSAFKLIISFINGLADAIRENHDALWDAIGNLITAIVEAIVDGVVKLANAVKEWFTGEGGILDAIGSFFQNIFDAGANLVQGFVDGLLSMPGAIWDAACGLAEDAWNAITGTLDEHSPSRLAFGGGANFVLGFINGIASLHDDAVSEAGAVAYGALSAFEAGLANDDLTFSPVYTPVIDSTQIQNGINTVNGMMNSIPSTYGINADLTTQNRMKAQMMEILGSGNDYSSILTSIDLLRKDVSNYTQAVTNMQVVMDNGTLVGQLSTGIDASIGREAILKGRGI